ncbi:hypothetical protein CDD81_8144 [Ophiocordyceps australis]|uniref:7-dehydrocholesterol reductase n=1 Tax=Ophiocordyceps australis TaxID=1399860 RepID=A0A2C5Y1N2_9HYPO|nr:hypothetical protein CDD81_8144 [Ophiocordyceps australis]
MYEPRATGRASIALDEAMSFSIIAGSPLFFFLFYYMAYNDFGAELSSAAAALYSQGPSGFFLTRLPLPTVGSVASYAFWVLSQSLLYHYLPGRLHRAPRTPGGRRLMYKLNGLRAWLLTVGVAAMAAYFELLDPALIARHWGPLLAAANLYCLALIGVFYVKARVRPDNAGETLLTGKS